MTTEVKPQWPFYAAWIILTGLCVPAAFVLYFIIIKIVNEVVGDYIYVDGVQHITEDYLFGYIFIPAAGLLIGLVQYLLLRRVLPRMGWWVPATVAGWFIGLALVFSLQDLVVNLWSMETYFAGNWAMDVTFIQLGLSIGLCQWLVLRNRVSKAWWWIVATGLGWGLLRLVTSESLGLFSLMLLTLLPAGATAVALAFLLNQESPSSAHGQYAS